jgi:protein-S-isoprenylcysteine O-methyltransferase Ste14
MALMPAFEIGLWNAWIFVIPILVIAFSDMRVTAARESGQSADFQLTRKEKRIINAIFLPMVVSFIYAVFLPLRLGAAWLCGGLVIYSLGVAFSIVAVLNFATSPRDKLITRGVYRISRNPMYVGLILMQVGLGIMCSSWLYLLLTLVLLILLNENLSAEERYCLYRYGDSYREYVNRTPRWIGIPKAGTESDQGK